MSLPNSPLDMHWNDLTTEEWQLSAYKQAVWDEMHEQTAAITRLFLNLASDKYWGLSSDAAVQECIGIHKLAVRCNMVSTKDSSN